MQSGCSRAGHASSGLMPPPGFRDPQTCYRSCGFDVMGRMSMTSIGFGSMQCRLWGPVSLVLILTGYSAAAAQLRLAREPVAVHSQDIDYLRVGGKTFQATIFQPEGAGPFPAILDVHGGAWTREDVRRDEHAHFDKALAAMGIVVVAIDYRQSPQYQ